MYWRVLRHVVKRPAFPNLCSWCQGRNFNAGTPTKTSNPLRILFCGSDDFSIASLIGIHEEQKRNPELIASIDVLCRPGKPFGRDLKKVREVPIKAVAQELCLPIHERDTFTGWDLPNPYPEPINLIIAVSFGLFIPPRILKSVEYGGLNVHPSTLPNFRGPAPLHHTIMRGAKYAGVTLQTLDEKSFDHGVVLSQTPKGSLPVPFGGKCTYDQLLNYVKPVASAMLVQGLRDRVFVPPHVDVGWLSKIPAKLIHAKKITAADKWVNWREHSAISIERRYRALGRLWSLVHLDPETKQRIIFEDMEVVPLPEPISNFLKRYKEVKGGPMKPTDEEKEAVHFVVMADNGFMKPRFYVLDGDAVIISGQMDALRVRKITVEGKGRQDAATVMKGFKDWKQWKIRRQNFHVNVLPKEANHSTWQWKPESHVEAARRLDQVMVEQNTLPGKPGSDGELAKRLDGEMAEQRRT